ncbi:MAG: hypothetical protein HeimC2_13320, partial [Candidatus Heimdallarchaeota archaeon LC_2]
MGSMTSVDRSAELAISDVDIVNSSQNLYNETLKEQLERIRQHEQRTLKEQRFYQHLYDNILHYMRAIWAQEDPQQRMLRYEKQNINVSLTYDFTSTDPTIATLNDILDLMSSIPLNDYYELDVEFTSNNIEVAKLHEIINPAGPIGYYGNYAIFYIRPEFSGDQLFTILEIIKTPYLFYDSISPE